MTNLIFYCLLIFILVISIAFQSTLFNLLKIWLLKPDLVLLIIIVTGLFSGQVKGSIIGLIGGFLEGTVVSESFSSFLISRTASGYLAGILRGRILPEKLIVVFFCIFLVSLTNELVFLLFSGQIPLGHWLKMAPLKAIYNGFFGLVIFFFLLRLQACLGKSVS